ncbi:MAG TPA: hypothetical protein VGF18_02025, partial [Candidatus Tumulicola sp.]
MQVVHRFVLFVFVVAIAGCSGSQNVASGAPPATQAQSSARHSWIDPAAATGDLLYVSDDGYGSVMVYSYSPQTIKFVGTLASPISPGPMCVDKQQNVWILGER